ncbi:MAG: type II 3-dehydroquinate dehydratase [Oligoflexus sp.]
MTQKKKYEILVINGVNLDLLGKREPEIYGHMSLASMENEIRHFTPVLESWLKIALSCEFYQTNHEGQFLEKLSAKAWDGVLMNPGAWTHTSLALADRLKALNVPYAEVHLSNIAAREPFRHHSYSASQASGVVYGFGSSSYLAGLVGLLHNMRARHTD